MRGIVEKLFKGGKFIIIVIRLSPTFHEATYYDDLSLFWGQLMLEIVWWSRDALDAEKIITKANQS